MEDIDEEIRSGDSQRQNLHQAQLDISQGIDKPLNRTIEDYQYFDSDFDKLLSLSHQVNTYISHVLLYNKTNT